MVQIIAPSPRAMQQGQIGQALGLGVARNFQDPQQMVQRQMLQKAMGNLPQNASYLDVLKAVGPEFMTTPGGSQLLAEMGPILQKQAQSQAYLDYLRQNQGQGAPGMNGGGGMPQPNGQMNAPLSNEVKPFGQEYFANPTPPVGKEGTYPKMSALPEPMPIMTPQEQQQRIQQLTAATLAQGQPADPVAIQNTVQNEQTQRMLYNQQIEKERGIREEKQQAQSKRMITRFEQSSSVPKSEEDKVVFEKFANEARDAANENDAYTYARAKYNEFDTARNGLMREADVPGFATKMFRQAFGSYKNKESMIKDLQPNIKKMKELGLENEARDILSNNLGLGKEDVELAMFPPSKEESKTFEMFPNNPQAQKIDTGFNNEFRRYPGEESALNPEGYIKFKDQVADILEKYPDTNLVALRGILNANKKYSWNDISNVYADLIKEGRFHPNAYQGQQLNVTKAAPIPSLGMMFKEFWTGTR